MAGRDHGAKAVSWWSSTVPTTGPVASATTWVWVRFRVPATGRVFGLRFYDGFGSEASALCLLLEWTNPRTPRGARFYAWPGGASANAWRQVWLRPVQRVVPGVDYMAAALYAGGGYFRNATALAAGPVTHNGITFVSSGQSTALDLTTASAVETTNANSVDVLFYPG